MIVICDVTISNVQHISSQNDPALQSMMLDEQEIKATQVQQDKRRMSRMSVSGKSMSGLGMADSDMLTEDEVDSGMHPQIQ